MDWITMPLDVIPKVLLSTFCIYVAVILFTRMAGLRSFSKMSSFDFAMTIAIGSLMASTIIAKDPPLFQAIVALAGLYLLQILVAYLRSQEYAFIRIVDNKPLLLMDGDKMIKENMQKAMVTQEDLLEKLRESNVVRLSQVKAVIFETTGDVSVLHEQDSQQPMDVQLIENVIGAEKMKNRLKKLSDDR